MYKITQIVLFLLHTELCGLKNISAKQLKTSITSRQTKEKGAGTFEQLN